MIQVSDDESAQKRAKGSRGQVIAMKKTNTAGIDTFLDRAMSVEEVDKANIRLLR